METTSPNASICSNFAQSGECRFGNNCRFQHVASPKSTTKKNKIPSKKPKGKGKVQKPPTTTRSTAAKEAADPLQKFFATFPSFDYRPNQPSSQEFYRLCDHFAWDRRGDDNEKRKKAHAGFKIALVRQFNRTYGVHVDDMQAWTTLCHDLDIDPLPEDADEAKKIIRALFVNLVDLVDTRRTGARVTRFASLEELQDYTISTGRFFPKQSAYAGGVLRFLLREILG